MLDTHAILYYLEGDARLGEKARIAIDDPANEKFFGLANIWEVAIKLSIGNLQLEGELCELPAELAVWQIKDLPYSISHFDRVAMLPLHHRDPFDRMLAAQCHVEDLTIVSRGAQLDAYGVQRVW